MAEEYFCRPQSVCWRQWLENTDKGDQAQQHFQNTTLNIIHIWPMLIIKTSQDLQMLSSLTLNCQVSQLSEMSKCSQELPSSSDISIMSRDSWHFLWHLSLIFLCLYLSLSLSFSMSCQCQCQFFQVCQKDQSGQKISEIVNKLSGQVSSSHWSNVSKVTGL